MTLQEAGDRGPSLKLVLSLLDTSGGAAVDWLLVHLAAPDLGTAHDAATAKQIFHEVTKLFIQDIKTLCETASPDADPLPLRKYMCEGRGLVLLSGLQKTVARAAVFNEELAAVLLSLETFLSSPAPAPAPAAAECPLLEKVTLPHFCPDSFGGATVGKKRKHNYRSSRVRRRASRSAFPDVTVSSARPGPGNLGENLTEWEGSPSSDQDTDMLQPFLASHIKYIPINYFQYFDNSNLDSDEFTKQSVTRLPRPPALAPAVCGVRQLMEACLQLVAVMTSVTARTGLSPRTQTSLLQLGLVASNQLKVVGVTPAAAVCRAQLVAIVCGCVAGARCRPDLVLAPPLQTLLATLEAEVASPDLDHATWSQAARCGLAVWRGLGPGQATAQLQLMVAAVVRGLQSRPAGPDTAEVVGSLVAVLPHIPDTEAVCQTVNTVLGLVTGEAATPAHQATVIQHLTSLFTVYCYPADQLRKLTSRIHMFIQTDNFKSYLKLLEQAMDNLAESEQKWTAIMDCKETDTAGKVADKDSALSSTETELTGEEENNNRSAAARPDRQLLPTAEFEPYLAILECGHADTVELVRRHLERIVARADGETRHRLALQLLIPHLAAHLDQAAAADSEEGAEAVLGLLATTVTQQPTAMALIRNQAVWRQIKVAATTHSSLSHTTQLVIKSIVLNSNKFIKIRLSEAEAMALQDDENDLINFDQRDRNAQNWLFKQFYHVLVQSSVPVVNGEASTSLGHLASAWLVALDLVRRLPDFLVYAIERGVITLGLQLLAALSGAAAASTVGNITHFLTFILATKSSWEVKVPNLEISNVENFFEKEIAEKLKIYIEKTFDLKAIKTVLSVMLQACCADVQCVKSFQTVDIWNDGYEADESDVEEESALCHNPDLLSVTFTPGIKLFTWCLNQILEAAHIEINEKLSCLEYLLYKFSLLDLSDKTVNKLINDGILSTLLDHIYTLSLKDRNLKLEGVTVFAMKIVEKVSMTYLAPLNIKKLFRLLNNRNSVQKLVFKLFTAVLVSRAGDYNIPSVSITGSRTRDRLSSAISSDSGLDSNLSLSSNTLSLSSSRKILIRDAIDDLEKDYTVILRLKIDVVANRSRDEWMDLIKVENRSETLGVQVNLVKGLRITLSNVKGTFAAAETNFQSMFEPGKWTHVVLMIGTVSEGSRSTKTLSAFLDCCRVWDVGLSVDTRLNGKVKKEKFLCLSVGQSGQNANNSGLEIKTSDVFFISATYTLQEIVQDYLTESKYLLCDQKINAPTRINLKRLGDKLADLIGYFLPLVNGEGPLPMPANMGSKLVAHFSPTGLWNSRTFESIVSSWTLQHGIFSVGGLDSILLLPAAAIEFDLGEEVTASSFNAAINFVLSDQEYSQCFQTMGGYPLFSHLLKLCDKSMILKIVNTFLNNCGQLPPASGFNPNSKILLFPELITLMLDVPIVTRTCMKHIVNAVIEFLNEENVYNRFNLNFMKSSGLLTSLLGCLVSLSKDCLSIPVPEVTSLLSCVPSSHEFIETLINSSILLCPPHLLYLPAPAPASGGREDDEPRPAASLSEQVYYEKIHSKEVVDLSSVLNTSLKIKCSSVPDLRDDTLNLDYLETEESKVEEWEVLTVDVKGDEALLVTNTSQDVPPPPRPAPTAHSATQLLTSLLEAAVTKLKLLSDIHNQHLFSPSLLLPLIRHDSPEVHCAALQLVRLMMERRSMQKSASANFDEMFQLIAVLISGHPATPGLVEAALSLVHGHQVNIDIAYEFSMTTYSSINIQTVTPILPPILRTAYKNVALCHNFLSQVHELAANIPAFLSRLLESGMYQSLFSTLLQLGAAPGPASDVCGFFESDLLVEDIQNLLRLVIVRHVDQTQADWELVLDMLFLAAAMTDQQQQQAGHLRSSLCLMVEEALHQLQSKCSDHRLYRPSHFLNIEDCALYSDHQHGPAPRKRSDRVGSNLAERFSKLLQFSVNCLSSFEQPIIEEEIGLATAIYNMSLELEADMSRKKESDNLVKSLRDCAALGGVTLLMLIKSEITLNSKIGLIRKLDALSNTLTVIQKLFVSPVERETFRISVISLVSQSLMMDNVDCEMVTRFYGDMLSVSVFPEGPGACEVSEAIYHKSFKPWQAERDRCSSKLSEKDRQKIGYLRAVSEKLTNIVVHAHDNLMKESLEASRRAMCRSYDSRTTWKSIVENQVHPLGLWHDSNKQPKSFILEDISGTSGIYTRLKPGHCGLTKSKFFKSDDGDRLLPVQEHFPQLLRCDHSEEISLADRLGGVETVQTVEAATQVTATSSVPGELVLSGNCIYFVAALGWSASLTSIEAACKRRYQLKDVAIEFFLTSGETHLIVFGSVAVRNSLFAAISRAGVPGQLKSANLEVTTKLWRQGHLTNFQYLLELNRLAGRTFNDLMQYPVMPWILADYTSPHLNLTSPQAFRCLRKPIAVQVPGSEEKYVTNYEILAGDVSGLGGVMGPYHYSSHYSNTGIVLHFLVRLLPFTQEFVKFQDGNFDLPDRSFHKLATSWLMASEVSASDVKELIPQLFYLPEMFMNRECFNFGVRQNGEEVNNVELPDWAPDARTFVKVHRQALESSWVRQELAHWIDLVFGYKQTGQEAVEAVNVFHPATYQASLQSQQLDSVEARARQTMIETYGQTPLQLFTSAHPLPLAELVDTRQPRPCSPPASAGLSTVTGLTFGRYVGAPGQPAPTVVWQQSQGLTVARLLRLETNEILGVAGRSLVLGRYSPGRVLGRISAGVQLTESWLLSWGHSDNSLHCRAAGEPGSDTQLAADLLAWDPPVCGASHPRVAAVWLGHQSGLISVYSLALRGQHQAPEVGRPRYLHGHTDQVHQISLCPEFGVAVSSGQDRGVVTWDLHSRRLLHTISLDTAPGPVLAAISATCGDIAVAADTSLFLYTINLTPVGRCEVGDKVTAVTFSNEEEGVSINCVAAGLVTGQVRMFSSLDLRQLRVVAAPSSPVTSLVYSQDSQNLAVATQDGVVTIFEKSGNKGMNRTPRYLTLQ